jgi:hypothetical protein
MRYAGTIGALAAVAVLIWQGEIYIAVGVAMAILYIAPIAAAHLIIRTEFLSGDLERSR